ncbi:hypothetical protein C8Q70DRAFT_1045390 [Cubamyces menziesii]|nr:hypothetical protein C8Q70DRAFT_1045390 [Cubamyces menziesii]
MESDLEILRPFALKVETNMPGTTFAKLPYAFPRSHIGSWKTIQSRVAQLSGFEPQLYHCCVNSCCAFTGPHADSQVCPYCKADRYDPNGRPRKLFVYLPVIPRLKAYLANLDMAKKMQYRAKEHIHEPGVIKDVMDSEHYRALLAKAVTVDGKVLNHKFFEDIRDVALGLSTDGFAPCYSRSEEAH